MVFEQLLNWGCDECKSWGIMRRHIVLALWLNGHLAVRFQKAYRHSDQMNWFEPFETSLPLLEDCLSSSATDFAGFQHRIA
jgi:hypothetical protein